MTHPFVSVIIPVYNDLERLGSCLEAFEYQTYPEDMYEVIVVDNNSEPPITENLLEEFPHAKLSCEEKQSSYAARNKGISVASGEIIAFTDSDCIPAENWIEIGVRSITSNPDCGLIAGRIEVFPRDPSNINAVELWEMVFAFRQREYVEKMSFGATANIFTRREVIDEAGMFNPELISGGDVVWGNKVKESGYTLIYDERLLVRHPARRTLKDLLRKNLRLTYGEYSIHYSDKPVRNALKLFLDLIPPVVTMSRIARDERFLKMNSNVDKLRILLICVYSRYSRTAEGIRLLMGGKRRKLY